MTCLLWIAMKLILPRQQQVIKRHILASHQKHACILPGAHNEIHYVLLVLHIIIWYPSASILYVDVAYTVEMHSDRKFTTSLFLPILNITMINYKMLTCSSLHLFQCIHIILICMIYNNYVIHAILHGVDSGTSRTHVCKYIFLYSPLSYVHVTVHQERSTYNYNVVSGRGCMHDLDCYTV